MRIELLRRVRVGSFWRGFYRGLASPVELFAPPGIGVPYRSDAKALREDWKNVGRDFRTAMRYERDALAGNR